MVHGYCVRLCTTIAAGELHTPGKVCFQSKNVQFIQAVTWHAFQAADVLWILSLLRFGGSRLFRCALVCTGENEGQCS